MEMEFKDNGRRRKVFLVLGVVLALAAGGAAFYLSSKGTAKAAEVPMKTVIVAAREIPSRSVIEAGMLAERSVPEDPTVEQAVVDSAMLIGRLTGVTIYANQAITPNLLATSAVGAEFSILSATETISPDSPTWRAVAIFVPKDRAVAGNVEIGQRVDLFVTIESVILVPGEDVGQPGPHGADGAEDLADPVDPAGFLPARSPSSPSRTSRSSARTTTPTCTPSRCTCIRPRRSPT
ncbi:MAG: hypothetical protein H0T04_02510 [Chloroflexi bacterium]|nr:hypothetical protein [Chloroflexota bacterium]